MPRRMRLTDAAIARLPAEASEYTIWDTRTAGLGVRVRPSGRRSYIYLGPVGTKGAVRKHTLGPATHLSITDARRAVLALLTGDRGATLPDSSRSRERMLFRDFVESMWGPAFLGRYKPSTRRWVTWCLRAQLLPAFGVVPLIRITPNAVHRWFDRASSTAPGGGNKLEDCERRMRRVCERRRAIISEGSGRKRNPNDGLI